MGSSFLPLLGASLRIIYFTLSNSVCIADFLIQMFLHGCRKKRLPVKRFIDVSA